MMGAVLERGNELLVMELMVSAAKEMKIGKYCLWEYIL
jgi:hypothetical protein